MTKTEIYRATIQDYKMVIFGGEYYRGVEDHGRHTDKNYQYEWRYTERLHTLTSLLNIAMGNDAEEKLKQLAARLCGDGLTPEFSVGQGDPGREIARMAHEFGADLVVIGTRGETGWRHALFGSVAERVVRLTTCPVLAARPTREH